MFDEGMLSDASKFCAKEGYEPKNRPLNSEWLHVEVGRERCVSPAISKEQVKTNSWNLRRERVSCRVM